MLTKICRRLQEKERKIVTSGSVFVFDERESGIKRWTDGLVWSPSRILGNFLIYRELDKRVQTGKKDSSPTERQRSNSTDMESQAEKNKERALVGSLTNSYRFKKGGLIKKTMSIMVNGVSQHMISYYTKEDVIAHKLKTPSSIPSLAILEIAPEFLLKQNFRIPPVIESTYEQDLEGISYGKSSSTVSSASPHAILPKPGGGTVSPSRLTSMELVPSRIKIEMENVNSSNVEIYRPTSYYPSSNSSNYHSVVHSHYASSPYATPNHHHVASPNGVNGAHTLPMPSMRSYINRQASYHEYPPPPRLLTSPSSQSNQPLIPSIGSHQNDYNNYYHSSSPQSYPSSPQNYPTYSSHSSTHANNSPATSTHGSNHMISQQQQPPLPPPSSQQQTSGHLHADTGGEAFNTLGQVPLYATGNPYNDLSSSIPDLYNTLNSPSPPTSAPQSHQHHEHLVGSPSPTLPAISSPTSTASITNNSSSNAPVTPPLSSPNNTATIVNPGNGGNQNIFGPYYSSLIKNEGYPSSVSNNFMYDAYWEMRN
ncbi:16088_t:CDS:2 [Acaulospora colombiana]|uniref:16088_t:CDS:1 n=1 Tax=Acaulospora colombiana TaxID=27376 RepID=A0ACA9LPP2_9GLOM|nr:16088_t:CDS:2 [Acaulospora colombiana]